MIALIRKRYPCFLRKHDFRWHHRAGNLRIYRCTRCTASARSWD